MFSKVRELSPNEAVEALMARLSYSASIRAEVATRRCAEKLSVLETFKVAATFSLLVSSTGKLHDNQMHLLIVNLINSGSSEITVIRPPCRTQRPVW